MNIDPLSEEEISRARAAEFLSVVRNAGHRLWWIFVTQVDPDALGSAFGLAEIIERVCQGSEVKIVYCGSIGHPQNKAIANRYNLTGKMVRADDKTVLPEGASVVLVDSSALNDSRVPKQLLPFQPRVVIDHHRGDVEAAEDRFVWIDENQVGSASTLVVELGGSIGDDFSFSAEANVLLAMGIYSDTGQLVNAGERDRRAYGLVTKDIDPGSLEELIDYPLPPSHFAHLAYTLGHSERRDGYTLASVGYIRPDEADDIATIADWLMRAAGTTLVIVWGVTDGVVRICARTNNIGIDLSQFLRERFGPRTGAKLSPGGKGIGGGQLELNIGWLNSPETRSECLALIAKRVAELVFPPVI